jgi:hypothetical protein
VGGRPGNLTISGAYSPQTIVWLYATDTYNMTYVWYYIYTKLKCGLELEQEYNFPRSWRV